MKKFLAIAVLLVAIPALAAPNTFQVTIGAGTNTVISSVSMKCSSWTIQNNATHNIRFGGSATSGTVGTVLASGSPGGSYTSTGSLNGSQPVPDDLSQWYVAGTNGDVVDVTCKQIQ